MLQIFDTDDLDVAVDPAPPASADQTPESTASAVCTAEIPTSPQVRFARIAADAWLDLDGHRAVRIGREGWEIMRAPDGTFRRADHHADLPAPTPNGSIAELAGLISVSSADGDFLVVVSWLVATLLQELPLPALLIVGPRACGKSWFIRVLRTLIDPVASPLMGIRSTTLDEVLRHHAVPTFDHVTSFSNDLCGQLSRVITSGCQPDGCRRGILMTADSVPVDQSGLLDRILVVELPSRESYATEAALMEALRRSAGRLLGSLLDLAVAALATQGPERCGYRFPGFTRVGRAVASATGNDPTTFERHIAEKQLQLAHEVNGENLLSESLLNYVRKMGPLKGSIRDLRDLLIAAGSSAAIPRQLGPRLRSMAPHLRKLGVEVIQHPRTNAERTWEVRMTP